MAGEIADGFIQAIQLIVTGNPEVMRITLLSLEISLAATILSASISIPAGALLYYHEFFGKRVLVNILQTLYALPTVLAGLLLFLLISHQGPLGFLSLLYTPYGMVIAQMILVLPLITGLTFSTLSGIDPAMRSTVLSLGATKIQSIGTLILETRFGILAAVILGFGRAISEVGAAMIIGGNIRGYTRVLTTAISLETSIGDFALAIALGIVLLGVALLVNIALNLIQSGSVLKNTWIS
ncbi:MAG TPA: ABC transporter permease [Methanomicrobiales archaeon]|nr:ABC transporter permease [Methanomicrobiales archaeon]